MKLQTVSLKEASKPHAPLPHFVDGEVEVEGVGSNCGRSRVSRHSEDLNLGLQMDCPSHHTRLPVANFFFFGLFMAAPAAYGGSPARGLVRAVAAGLHSHSHSCTRSEPHLQPTPQLTETLDP